MKRKLLPLASSLIAWLFFGLAGICSAQDFNYIADPPHVQVSPNTVIPDGLPYCNAGITLICYGPSFIKKAYNFPSDLDGTGQTILIVDAFGSPTIEADLSLFDTIFGVPAPPSFTIFCPRGCPPFNPNDKLHGVIGWSVETSLDVEYAHAMAPGANIVLVVASTEIPRQHHVAKLWHWGIFDPWQQGTDRSGAQELSGGAGSWNYCTCVSRRFRCGKRFHAWTQAHHRRSSECDFPLF